jgi:hypothetical protein
LFVVKFLFISGSWLGQRGSAFAYQLIKSK